ncbi:MAG: hypothetical protein H7147_01435 [Frankiaceae bacterium]|nr:hypothetical protein [Arenimonas sp.]
MMTNFVLVDFENVQPVNMGLLKGGPFKIKVFLGASQAKISLEMAQALQTFGDDAEYIQVVGSGKDALDFHIAYYIGKLAAENPGAAFSIISKDTGFDPLVKHLKLKHVECRRSASIAEIPQIKSAAPAKTSSQASSKQVSSKQASSKPAAPKTTAAPAKSTPRQVARPTVDPSLVNQVLDNLDKRRQARPATIKTLRSTIASLLKPVPSEAAVDALVAELSRLGKITVTGTKVRYAPA